MKKVVFAALALCVSVSTVSAQDYFKTLAKVQKQKNVVSWETVPLSQMKEAMNVSETDELSEEDRATLEVLNKIESISVRECDPAIIGDVDKALKGYESYEVPQSLKEIITGGSAPVGLRIYTREKKGCIRETVWVITVDMYDDEFLAIADLMFVGKGIPVGEFENVLNGIAETSNMGSN